MKLTKVAAIALLSIVLVSTAACGTKSYQLYTSVSGQGVVSPSSGTYDDGELVSIAAVPSSGWEFDYWDGGVTGSENPVYIRMHSNKNVEAHFTEIQVPTPTPTATPTPTPTPMPTPIVTPTPTLTPGFETYTDYTNGFSISIPDSWETESDETGAFFFPTSQCAGWYPFGGVTASYEERYTSVQTYYTEVLEPLIENFDEYGLISRENLTIDGISAIKVTYTYVDSYGYSVQETGCVLVKQQTVWGIVGSCDITCWNTYEGTFNTMISSFRLLD
jgi:hypothetical protein